MDTPNSLDISPMRLSDVPAIAALEQALFSAPWDEASIRAELQNPLALWLTARQDDRVVGYVGSQTVFEDADILNLAVDPQFRRLGIGLRLMQRLEHSLADRGAEQITLEVRASNQPAIRLYTALGYTRAGLRRGYYERPREDALILQKRLVKP